jgi:hypothetical protein
MFDLERFESGSTHVGSETGAPRAGSGFANLEPVSAESEKKFLFVKPRPNRYFFFMSELQSDLNAATAGCPAMRHRFSQ